MVIGNGLVAKRFKDYSDNNNFLIFASGVSNSKSTDQAEYEREFNLLKRTVAENKDKTFVYFSTCSINDPEESSSAYVAHKKKIENFISSDIKSYLIFRVSNIVGRSANANTILNFIVKNINENTHFNLWVNATRNIIDIDDFFTIADHILKNKLFSSQIVNIANTQSYLVTEIVTVAEKYLNKKAEYTPIPKGGSFMIDISDINSLFEKLNINFGDNYLDNLFLKHYSQGVKLPYK